MTKITLPEDFDPAEPLRDPRYERFAQLRTIGLPCRKAADEAGFRSKGGKPILPGNAARLDRHPQVRARKAYLAGDDETTLREARAFVRDRLMAVISFDVLRQYAIRGEVEIGGQKVSRIVGIDWDALAQSEHSIAITNFKFDRETGVMVEFGRDDALAAIAQYRDMFGLRAPRKSELTGKGGGPVQFADVSAYTDDELAQLEAIQSAAESRAAGRGVAGGDGAPPT